jgi:lipoprotein-anchoring transpeptidase ErfK/SrfK
VRAGVSARIDSAPSGTHFVGAPMQWFLRLTGEGVGMHVGILPGYPASHGCIRESADGAKLFYDHARVGTPVDVGDY